MRTQRFLWILDDMAAVSHPVAVATRPHAKAAQLSTKKAAAEWLNLFPS